MIRPTRATSKARTNTTSLYRSPTPDGLNSAEPLVQKEFSDAPRLAIDSIWPDTATLTPTIEQPPNSLVLAPLTPTFDRENAEKITSFIAGMAENASEQTETLLDSYKDGINSPDWPSDLDTPKKNQKDGGVLSRIHLIYWPTLTGIKHSGN